MYAKLRIKLTLQIFKDLTTNIVEKIKDVKEYEL